MSWRDQNGIFVSGCKHVFFCGKVKTFNMGVYGAETTNNHLFFCYNFIRRFIKHSIFKKNWMFWQIYHSPTFDSLKAKNVPVTNIEICKWNKSKSFFWLHFYPHSKMNRLQHGYLCLSVLFRLSTSRRSSGWNPADPLRGDGVLHQTLNRGGYQYNAADPRITGRKGLVHTGLQPHRLCDQVLCSVYFMFVCFLCIFFVMAFTFFSDVIKKF